MKIKTHNLKWHPFSWNFTAFKLLFTYIHHSLISLSVLFKTYFGAKLVFMAGIFLKRYSWYMKLYFQFYFFATWSMPASTLPLIGWKTPAGSWYPSKFAMFFNVDLFSILKFTERPKTPGFSPFRKFQDTKEISMQTARVSRQSFRFLRLWWYSHGKTCALLNSVYTKIHWNTRLAASDVFHMFTQSITFF